MNYPLWFGNLAAYSLQIAVIVLAGTLAWALLRLKQPRLMLTYWRALLVACLLLPLLEPWQRIAPASAPNLVTGTVRIAIGESLASPFPLYKYVFLGLAAGVGLGFVRLVVGLCRLDYYRRTATRIVSLSGALREAQALVGVEPSFYVSGRVEVPVTFGWRDPAVIFPARFENMEQSHQRAIACHELLHVARRDWLQNLFEELVLTVFWFHPAVWWVIRNIRLGREQVVDCEVVELTGAREPYLHALLEIAGAGQTLALPAPLFLGESQLAQRVALLVKEVRMSELRLIASVVIALAVLVATGRWAVKTFWLTSPLSMAGPPTLRTVSASGEPGGSFTIMFWKVEGHVKGPVPISMPVPSYTPEARKNKVQGAVLATVQVDASGKMSQA